MTRSSALSKGVAVPEPAQWRERAPPDAAWKPRAGRSIEEARTEQDHAAGGRERRRVPIGQGAIAHGSVELKRFPKTRRIYAYLRWQQGGRTMNRYLGEVTAHRRAENLAEAWRIAQNSGLVEGE